MPAFPALTELADTYPLPSNATFRTGIGKLQQATTGLLGTTGTAPDARDALGIGSTISFRNKIINGRFTFNQRAVSGTVVLTAGQYGHDRWKAGSGGCTYTFSTSGGVNTITITAGSLVQVIAARNIAGGTYTVSRTGTAQGRIVGGTYAAAPFQITGVTAAATLSVEFGTGTLANVQVEPGAAVTPTEMRHDEVERLLCMAYCEAFPIGVLDHISANHQASQNNTYTVPMKFPKQGTPTFSSGWTTVNVTTISLGVAASTNLTLTVTNTAAGQFRITNSSIGFIESEI